MSNSLLLLPRAAVPALLLALSGSTALAAPTEAQPLVLWYPQPAKQWVEALPLGNGRLGAMVFGGVPHERLALNEDTFWSGQPHDYANPEALLALPQARRLIAEGKYSAAESFVSKNLLGSPRGQSSYQPIGDVELDFRGTGPVSDYRRELNLDTAVARVDYTQAGVKFHRELFCSPVSGLLVLRLSADQPGKITFSARLRSPQETTAPEPVEDTLVLQGNGGGSGRNGLAGPLKFEYRLRVLAQGGRSTTDQKTVTVGPRPFRSICGAILRPAGIYAVSPTEDPPK